MKMKLREVNNGRLAMVAITAMVAQELNTGVNLIPADEVLGFGVKGGGLKARVWVSSLSLLSIIIPYSFDVFVHPAPLDVKVACV